MACDEVKQGSHGKVLESNSFQISCDKSLFIIKPDKFYNIDGSYEQTVENVTAKDGLIYYTILTGETISPKQTMAINPSNKSVYIEKLTNEAKEPLKLEPKCKVLSQILE
ncbi:hypothetical protein D0N37_16280 [Pseudoalteromonas piscicida]|nr:hypothetical protein D0N37_16280 [Pseudoalteromonas piscicida]